jgi:hypothetical protein
MAQKTSEDRCSYCIRPTEESGRCDKGHIQNSFDGSLPNQSREQINNTYSQVKDNDFKRK